MVDPEREPGEYTHGPRTPTTRDVVDDLRFLCACAGMAERHRTPSTMPLATPTGSAEPVIGRPTTK
jgi:hypothetical protein